MANKRPPNAEATQFQSGEKAVINGKKGGIASGRAKRDKKMLRDCLEILLERKIEDENGDKMTGAEALSAKIFQRALKGDLRAFEIIRDTAGQKPIEKVMVSEVDPDVIAEIEAMVYDEDTSG